MGSKSERRPEYHFWLGRVKSRPNTFRDFDEFLKCVGARPSPRHSLYRPRPELPLGPGNCEWRPTGRALVIEHAGLRLTVPQWAKRLGISKQALYRRLAKHDLPIALSSAKLTPGPAKRLTKKPRGLG